MLEGFPWAPLIVQLGISGEERHFSRTAETMRILAAAMPHLSPATRSNVVILLDNMFESQIPLSKPVFSSDGKRREPYELGPAMMHFATQADKYEAGIEDLYAVWAYAHYANRWDKVLGESERITAICEDFARGEFRFAHNGVDDDAEHLNRRIAGVLGGIRIMDKSGASTVADKLRELLAMMVSERIHHERADSWLIRPTKVASKGLHQAKVTRYVGLVPEVAAILRRFAGEPFGQNVRDLMHGLPLWYHAYGERMIGGENYISPPHLSQALFIAAADGSLLGPEQLAAKLDQPWCKADLYYIEKITAISRELDHSKRR